MVRLRPGDHLVLPVGASCTNEPYSQPSVESLLFQNLCLSLSIDNKKKICEIWGRNGRPWSRFIGHSFDQSFIYQIPLIKQIASNCMLWWLLTCIFCKADLSIWFNWVDWSLPYHTQNKSLCITIVFFMCFYICYVLFLFWKTIATFCILGLKFLFLPGTNNFLPYLSNLYNLLGGELGITGTIKWNSSSYRDLWVYYRRWNNLTNYSFLKLCVCMCVYARVHAWISLSLFSPCGYRDQLKFGCLYLLCCLAGPQVISYTWAKSYPVHRVLCIQGMNLSQEVASELHLEVLNLGKKMNKNWIM